MSSYKNFQDDNFKFTKDSSRLSDNPSFNSQVKVNDLKKTSFENNFDKWLEFVQWARWFPDLFYDLIKPETGGMRLDLDQRVFLRCMSRFVSTYGVFPRGFGKCQAGDTIIFTDKGMVELGSFFDYQSDDHETYIDSKINLINRYGQLESTNAGVYSGKKQTIIVRTEELYESENTFNHPVLVMTENGLEWKRTIDLQVGDYLPIKRGINTFGTTEIEVASVETDNKEIPKVILSAPKNIVAKYVQGLFDTDGGISNNHIEYCTVSEKLSKQVQTVLLNFGIISTRTKKYIKKYDSYAYTICVFSKNINIFKEEIGFSCKRKQEKLNKIADFKRNVNKDIIPYMSNVVKEIYSEVKSENPYLYDQLYNVMKGNNDLTYEKLDFILSLNGIEKSKHYNLLLELNSNNYFFSKVQTLQESENHVYDLSLPKTHSFIANGFVSHNTMLELMSIYHTCIFFPDITISMSAQTKENAASISEEKHNEIMKWFPLMKNELAKPPSFTKDSVEVEFKSGGVYSILANSQTSKGQRRRRLNIEESALLDNALFKDALEPVVNVPRRTIGKMATINPFELNGMINYLTTSGYRGSDEFNRILNMLDEMADLKGKIVLGASWELPCHYGRGETRNQILAKKNDPTTSSTAFAMNYESRWVGATDGALVNISKLLHLRTLDKPELECPRDSRGKFALNEYVIGVDVARSATQSNNKTAIVILKIIRNSKGLIRQVQLVNIIEPPNGLNFKEQSVIVKRLFYKYGGSQDLTKSRVKAIVVDGNVIGKGLIDRLLEDVTDPDTNVELGCFDTINTDQKPDNEKSVKIVYDLTSTGINDAIIRTFIDYVETEKLKLLKINDDIKKSAVVADDAMVEEERARLHTQYLIDEVSNLKLKKTQKSITVEQVLKKIDKDRYSALAYALYYIFLFLEKEDEPDVWDEYREYVLT